MNTIIEDIGSWFILVATILAFTGVTVETMVKPLIHTMLEKSENGELFKKTKVYDYLFRVVVFGVACVESYVFAKQLDIFATLGAVDGNSTSELAGIVIAALGITFFSKQIHDIAGFFKSLAKARTPDDTPAL